MPKDNPYIRPCRPRDLPALARIFHDSVRRGAWGFYTPAQLRAWSPRLPCRAAWKARMTGLICLLAEVRGRPAGFMAMTAKGHLDLAFTAPEYIGRGVGHHLYEALEQAAVAAGLNRLSTDASLQARPFFERHGWRVRRRQYPVRHGVRLVNFHMEKELPRKSRTATNALP